MRESAAAPDITRVRSLQLIVNNGFQAGGRAFISPRETRRRVGSLEGLNGRSVVYGATLQRIHHHALHAQLSLAERENPICSDVVYLQLHGHCYSRDPLS